MLSLVGLAQSPVWSSVTAHYTPMEWLPSQLGSHCGGQLADSRHGGQPAARAVAASAMSSAVGLVSTEAGRRASVWAGLPGEDPLCVAVPWWWWGGGGSVCGCRVARWQQAVAARGEWRGVSVHISEGRAQLAAYDHCELGSHWSSRTMDGSLLAPSMNSSRDSLPSRFLSICRKILSVRFSGVDSSSGIFITVPTILYMACKEEQTGC